MTKPPRRPRSGPPHEPGPPIGLPRASRRRRRPGNKPRRAGEGRSIDLEATYVCDSCGEEIVVPVDVTAGDHQDYVEDCPVCCNPMLLRVEIDADGEARAAGEHE